MAHRAPKQWSLTKNETISSFESWRQNLTYVLSLDPNFAPFLLDGATWLRKTAATPLRGLTDDPGDDGRTAAQKVALLDLMLGQIANYCPIIARNTIVKNSTSVNCVWQSIRQHFGFQTTGGHFLDFDNISLEPGEKPEDLYQRLTSFIDDNLLKGGGSISHNDETPDEDEEITPTVENLIVLTWLRLIHPSLPALVKQKYATELRSKTLATLKPEISVAINSLLDEVQAVADAKVLRSTFRKSVTTSTKPICPLCKQAGRPKYKHFLSKCNFLPEEDKKYINSPGRVRQTYIEPVEEGPTEDDEVTSDEELESSHKPIVKRVSTKKSPTMKAFCGHTPLTITLDSGAEISMLKHSVAQYIGACIKPTDQSALQADGFTPLKIVGETHIKLTRGKVDLVLEALVVDDLDVDVLAGIPFMTINDIAIRPAKHQISIGDIAHVNYGTKDAASATNRVRRTQAHVLRSDTDRSIIWPGSYFEVKLPDEINPEQIVAIEPNARENKHWLAPQVIDAVGGRIRVVNNTGEPQIVQRHEHLGYVRNTIGVQDLEINPVTVKTSPSCESKLAHSDSVTIDPDNMLSIESKKKFKNLLTQYDEVFSPNITGYNGSSGKFEAVVNMGPVEPPQRKGRVPQYSKDKLVELQGKIDELESVGVFSRPEDVGVTAEYLNPSFLVKKPHGGYRLVTAFSDVGRYSKPQQSLMPDVDSTLRTIGQWKYVIKSDLTSAFYQIPLSKQSMKYCGIVTPFRGIRVYKRCAMGMPGSETALEELMCRVLGDQVQDGHVAKLADDLYCGADDIETLLNKWENVLHALHKNGLRLAPAKTVICPKTTTILGWTWSCGQLSASPHRISTLSSCAPPDTVHGVRSYIGAYKFLARVLPNCSSYLHPLDDMIAGKKSQEKISWSDPSLKFFKDAQQALTNHKSIVLPKPTDQLWIVTDGSVSRQGLGATLYVTRCNTLLLAGFFSAKLRKHQVTWLPCEIEALSIAAAIKHFSPYLIQSKSNACVLTDSQPCVQAIEKLCRGEFSASPRITSFLSIVSRYQVNIRHLAGSVNVPSDFASRNAPECLNPKCQICTFIQDTEESVVRTVKVEDILNQPTRLPFTTRSSWIQIQSECPDLRRTHAHLKQGTRPSRKLTNIKDVKRYLQVATIGKDNLIVVKRNNPLLPSSELIVVPRSVLDGLVSALHIKLDHPTKHQLELVMKRHFYALDLQNAVERCTQQCHLCASLQSFPKYALEQTSEDPPEVIGLSFAADILKRNNQTIIVLRETVTSYTKASIIPDEKRDTIRDALACLSAELHPLDAPPAVIRVDAAPGFMALRSDQSLRKLNLVLEVGRVKNANKNPVAEKAIQELEHECLRYDPSGGAVTTLDLAIIVARLNSRLRKQGLSARELWTQRSQFTHDQLPFSDKDIIMQQHESREANHEHSEKSKSKVRANPDQVCVGDIVYLISDKSKLKARSRYIVVSCDGDWCCVKKFSGNQLRATSYRVKRNECYRVPSECYESARHDNKSLSDEECELPPVSGPPLPAAIPSSLTMPIPTMEPSDCPVVYPEYVPSLINEEPVPTVSDDLPKPSPPPTISNDLQTHSNDEATPMTRPQRTRKPPAYLADYAL